MRSYASNNLQLRALFREILAKYRLLSDSGAAVAEKVRDLEMVEARIRQVTGVQLLGKKILEIGPGQQRTQMACLALRNQIVGIDLEVIASGPLSYIRMWRRNGPLRTAKTVVRKLLGIDRRMRKETCRQTGAKTFPALNVVQMDVRDLSFTDGSFDFVYCRSVLQHVPGPDLALHQIARVLREGGVFYGSIHLFTSPTGHLDARIWDPKRRREVTDWQHLRPVLAPSIRPTAYLNRLRLSAWRSLFDSKMPGARLQLSTPEETAEITARAAALQAQGELGEYSLEELGHFELVAIWQKPEETSNASGASPASQYLMESGASEG